MTTDGFLTKRRTRVAAALATAALLPFILLAFSIGTPAGDGKQDVIVTFPAGASLYRIAAELEAKKIISSARLFTLYGRLHGDANRIKAGTYRLNDGIPPREILRKLAAGEIYSIPFALPPGYSIYQAAELLERQGFASGGEFLRACRDRALLRSLGIAAESAEGYLYPATYNLVGIDAEGLVRLMVTEFDRRCRSRFGSRVADSGMSWNQVLTLASMIEKEAAVPEERPVISSVFHNRLKRNMRLQSDPTSVYGIRAFAGKVSKGDILRRTRYNTYLVDGLPPGPIGNPGDSAIEAALAPGKTPYLYFVARNDGTHYFSETLEEHNMAVRKFLRSDAPGIRNEPPHPSGGR